MPRKYNKRKRRTYRKRKTPMYRQPRMPVGYVRVTFEIDEPFQISGDAASPWNQNALMLIGDHPSQGVQLASAFTSLVDDKYLQYINTFQYCKTMAVSWKYFPTITERTGSLTSQMVTPIFHYAFDRYAETAQLSGSASTDVPAFFNWMDDKEHSTRYQVYRPINRYTRLNQTRDLRDTSGDSIITNGRGYYDANAISDTGYQLLGIRVQTPVATGVVQPIGRVRIRWYCILKTSGASRVPPNLP